MPVTYVEFEDARESKGLRMVVVPGVPSPWSEAAKGIFHVKRIAWKAVRFDPANAALIDWTRERSAPVALFDDEAPRSNWVQILLLAERLAPTPPLVPSDPQERARMLGLCHEICGENGLGWVRRLQGVRAGLNGEPGFPRPIAQYLGDKYGYRTDESATYSDRVAALLGMLAGILQHQRQAGHRFFLGDRLSALDIYSATFMALFAPLPPDQCPMADALRPGFESHDAQTAKALDPILLEHRDFLYSEFLELPLSL